MAGRTAFVLGGGGVLGAVEVGMLRALFEHELGPTSSSAPRSARSTAWWWPRDPTPAVDRPAARAVGLVGDGNEVYGDRAWRQVRRACARGTHLHSPSPLRERLEQELGELTFEDLTVRSSAARRASSGPPSTGSPRARWSTAVLACAAVPGLLPPARVDGEHFLDGGIVNSIPVGRAVELGADRIFVLQVGRIDRPLTARAKPWEVARVAFEIARRHRFAREMADLPDGVRRTCCRPAAASKRRLPAGLPDTAAVAGRIEPAYGASVAYLEEYL